MYKRQHLSEEEHNRFIEDHPNGDLLQLTDWAASKKLTGWYFRRFAITDETSETRGAATLLFKKVPKLNATLCYISRGFVCDYHDHALVEAMLKEAVAIAKEEKAYTIKIDPDLPVARYEDALENLKVLGFRHHGFQDGMSKNTIQPRQTMVTDIAKDDASLLKSFERNNRTKVRSALRKGTEVYVASREDLPVFVDLMKETGERDGFLTRDITYFESMYDHLNPNGHMELFLVRLIPSNVEASVIEDLEKLDKDIEKAGKKKDGIKKDNELKGLAGRREKLENQLEEARRIKQAHPEGIILSGALLALSGHKAYYLYGASSNEYRDYLPNHHMQFVMMQYARDKGAKTYDFGGVSVMPEKDSPHFGLWQFKKVWGTEVSEKIGEFDFILRRPIYMAAEIGVPIFQKGKIRMNQLRKGKKE
ncbi:lipid II:glycine glycyltransferase FemX [Lacicoccus alkaliphilus]|uniref:Lipid II:glycine glycyltransferase n=1 Tax=Lacicoccus alkaliphilus DSM 16010 TaxID=1123231 RepID=A0A1M7EA46_9BACL|nr:lipid II:glycine glycyltransferase FemX [Salinicoccus alkaliphilus]SHL88625.1 peptidoglycan pentaglycine glycine transferase (the first glycine) [Salinicoccus alkaliphilus DSM 16010]